MAKHDQRILKFLTQNADRAPTITDMMTRLNISISDITSSLNSLMAQGMVSKRTNGQGIECWFPTAGSSQQLGNDYAQEPRGMDLDRRATDSRFLTGLNSPNPPEPSPLPPLQPTLPSLSASSAFPASLTASSANGPGLRSTGRESAAYAASAAASPTSSSTFSPAAPSPAARTASALESLPGVTPPIGGYAMAPVKSGVGFLTFVVGMIVAAAAAVFLSGRLVKKDVEAATRGFAEKAAFDEAVQAFTSFESKTKTHVKALEAQVKTLTDDLATMKAKSDSLEALTAKGAADTKKAEAAGAKKPARRKR